VSRGAENPFERSIPGFVRGIVGLGGVRLDGRLLRKPLWLVDTASDVDELVSLLTNPTRTADVIVVSLPEDSRNPQDALIPVDELRRLTIGAAHIAVISGPGSDYLSDALGKEFSVVHQGVRTYLRQFDPDRDEPFRHPLGVAARILATSDGGADAYFRLLVDKALASSTTVPDRDNRMPPHAELRRIAARRGIERAQQACGTDNELLDLALAENQELTEQLAGQKEHYDELLAMAETDFDSEKEASKREGARNYSLRLRIEALEAQLKELSGAEIHVPVPDSLDEFQTWCETYLSGTVELLNRAFKGVKNSRYDEPSFLYQVLLVLRDFYVPMRRDPGAQRKAAYEQKLIDLGLEESGTIAKERAGEQGDTYIVNVDGRPRMLDRHLKKGSSKDQRHCFRLYFFWDEGSQQAVVGWLPSHLDTRQT
jgi:Fe2+ transport system protein FeoA